MQARTILALLGAMALLLSGCGVGQGSAKEIGAGEPIKVGVIPVADFAPVYIALEEGYFAEAGLNVQTQVMQNAAAIAPSVINGQLQFGTSATTPFIAAAQKGLPVQAVANAADVAKDPAEDVSALLVDGDSTVQRPADLEGKTVAVNALSSILHIAAAHSIEADGGNPSKVTFVAMPLPDMMTALQQGRVDAASVVEPFATIGAANGARAIAHPYTDAMLPGGTFALFFTATPFAEKNPELVEKFVAALEKGSRTAAEHPEKVQEVLIKYGKLKPEVAASMLQPGYGVGVSPEALDTAAGVMHELGFLAETIKGADVIRP